MLTDKNLSVVLCPSSEMWFLFFSLQSKSFLPADWKPANSVNVKNLINEKKSKLAAMTSQKYREELARRTGTNVIGDSSLAHVESGTNVIGDANLANVESGTNVIDDSSLAHVESGTNVIGDSSLAHVESRTNVIGDANLANVESGTNVIGDSSLANVESKVNGHLECDSNDSNAVTAETIVTSLEIETKAELTNDLHTEDEKTRKTTKSEETNCLIKETQDTDNLVVRSETESQQDKLDINGHVDNDSEPSGQYISDAAEQAEQDTVLNDSSNVKDLSNQVHGLELCAADGKELNWNIGPE